MFALQYINFVRMAHHLPVSIDAPSIAALLAGLLLIRQILQREQPIALAALCAVTFAGVLIRESSLVIPSAFLVGLFFRHIKIRPIHFLPLVAGLVAFIVVRGTNIQTDEYSFMLAVVQLISEWVFWILPSDYSPTAQFYVPFLAVLSNTAQYEEMTSLAMHEVGSFITLIKYGVVIALLDLWL